MKQPFNPAKAKELVLSALVSPIIDPTALELALHLEAALDQIELLAKTARGWLTFDDLEEEVEDLKREKHRLEVDIEDLEAAKAKRESA